MSELKPSTMTDDERLKLIAWLESRAQGSTMPGASRMYKLALDAIRAQPSNEPLTCEGCEYHDKDAAWPERCYGCSRQSRRDLYRRKPEGSAEK